MDDGMWDDTLTRRWNTVLDAMTAYLAREITPEEEAELGEMVARDFRRGTQEKDVKKYNSCACDSVPDWLWRITEICCPLIVAYRYVRHFLRQAVTEERTPINYDNVREGPSGNVYFGEEWCTWTVTSPEGELLGQGKARDMLTAFEAMEITQERESRKSDPHGDNANYYFPSRESCCPLCDGPYKTPIDLNPNQETITEIRGLALND